MRYFTMRQPTKNASAEREATFAAWSCGAHSAAVIAPLAPTMSARATVTATQSRTASATQLATTSPTVGSSIGRCLVTRSSRVSNSSSRISIDSMAAKPWLPSPCSVIAAITARQPAPA